jgi:1A family penicillin-binding protein
MLILFMRIFFFKPKNGSGTIPEKKSVKKSRKWVKILFRVFLTLFFIGTVSAVALFAWVAKDLPSPGKINKRVIAESTKIYDRSGEHLLYEVHGEEKRTIIPFEEIPKNVRAATISLEDQDFYSHHGIKLSSIIRAVLKDVISRDAAQGGSTITQQFVKNSLLTNEKTLLRKVKEVILSIEIEQKFSKDEILAMYLNEIPYGSNAYGIEAAAQTFFGKHARDLSLDEAALLASLPQAPSYYSPYGSHRDAIAGRRQFALRQMSKLGYINEEQMNEALNIDVFEKVLPQKHIIAAPHFVMYIKEYLSEKYGESVEEMGLRVYTTLDWEKQIEAERIVKEKALENDKKWNAENAALVAMDPKTGQIIAMVGSRDYFDKEIDGQVNVVIRDRQPGSSFKPYVYLAAFQKGYTPETMLYDVETQFDTAEGKEYKPQNYDGKFRGPLHMKEALAQSLNIPAVKTLYLVGVKDAITLAKSLGITGLNDEDRYGLSLVLGGGEITLLDHVSAYSTLAQGGIKRQKTAILRIEDAKGVILEEFKADAGERVIDEKYVAMLDHVMSTNAYRAPVFGENSPLRSDNRPMAAKTGTTNEFRDGWTVGHTPSLSVGVWAGNNDNTSMVTGADGVNVAAPIWRAFMDFALKNTAIEEFPKYDPEEWKDEEWMKKPMLGGKLDEKKDVKVCEIPGKNDKYCLANEYCRDKDVKKKDFIEAHEILHYVTRDDPHGAAPDKPDRDAQYKTWEEGVKDWYKKDKNKKDTINAGIPEEKCQKDDFSEYLPEISLSVPGSAGTSFSAEAEADAPYGIDYLKIFVDGDEIASGSGDSISKTYDTSEKNGESVTVRAKIRDKNGNEKETEKDVVVSF